MSADAGSQAPAPLPSGTGVSGHDPFAATVAKYASSRFYRIFLGALVAFLRPRLLTPEQFGLWTLLKVIPTYAGYAHLGARDAMRFFMPYHRARNDERKLAAIRDSVFAASLVLNASVALGLLAWGLLSRRGADVRWGLATVAALVVLNFVAEFVVAVMRADEKFDLIARINYIETTVVFVLTPPCLLLFGLYGLYLTVILTGLAVVAYAWFRYPLPVRLRFDSAVFRELLAKGAPIMGSDLLIALVMTSDRLIVSALLDRRDLGYYGVAGMVFLLLMQLPGSAREVMEPRAMKSLEGGADRAFVDEYFLKPLLHSAYLMPFLVGPAVILTPAVLSTLLPRYVAGIAPTQALVLGAYFLALAYVPRPLIVANNWQLRLTCLLPLVVAVNVVVSVAFVKAGWGLTGVAAGSSVSFAPLFVTLFAFVSRQLGSGLKESARRVAGLFLPFGVALAALAAVRCAASLVRARPLVACIPQLLVYFAILLLLHCWAVRRHPLLSPAQDAFALFRNAFRSRRTR